MITASASSAIRSNRSGKSPFAAEVGVAEDGEVAEVGAAADTADVGQPVAQMRLPDRLLRRLRREEHDALALVEDEPLDEHQADEGLAETDAVAEERAAVLAGDLHQRPVASCW